MTARVMSEQISNPSEMPVLGSGLTFRTVTEKISSTVLGGTPRVWYVGFGISFVLAMLLLFSITYVFVAGVGVMGINVPVAWAFAITNFVWWIGIGHAGTLISAILLLLRQTWRTSINRFAEAMTLFAVACAALFPILHLGRWYFAYWLIPYPSVMGVWPQFRSPLVWDFFAVTTYGTVSLLFWYVGLVPDLATMRDRAPGKLRKSVYGILALGWRGSAYHWRRYHKAYFIIAALATPLVVSVHSIVSFDFAVGIIPGWHSTIFPPYFVAGAIFSGFAMVLTITIPLRGFYHLEDFVTMRHLNAMAKVMLASGLIVAYGYLMEFFVSWYSGNTFEMFLTINRALGPYAILFWLMMLCNVAVPQLLWSRHIRTNLWALFIISLLINVGMWTERFVIVVTSLSRDFMPSAWGMFEPTFWDWSILIGTLGLFFALMFLFIRLLPMISMTEVRELLQETKEEQHAA